MKKTMLLLSAMIFLVACGNKNTAVTTTSTTTTAATTTLPIIREVAYRVDGDEVGSYSIIRLWAKDNKITKMTYNWYDETLDFQKMSKKEQTRAFNLFKKNLESDDDYIKLTMLDGVVVEATLNDLSFELVQVFDVEKIDHDEFKETMGRSVYEFVLGEIAESYIKSMPLDTAEVILEAQGEEKIDEKSYVEEVY